MTADPYARGGPYRWLWWSGSRQLRPGLYFRYWRLVPVSMWLLRPRFSWNTRGYGRRWS